MGERGDPLRKTFLRPFWLRLLHSARSQRTHRKDDESGDWTDFDLEAGMRNVAGATLALFFNLRTSTLSRKGLALTAESGILTSPKGISSSARTETKPKAGKKSLRPLAAMMRGGNLQKIGWYFLLVVQLRTDKDFATPHRAVYSWIE